MLLVTLVSETVLAAAGDEAKESNCVRFMALVQWKLFVLMLTCNRHI